MLKWPKVLLRIILIGANFLSISRKQYIGVDTVNSKHNNNVIITSKGRGNVVLM